MSEVVKGNRKATSGNSMVNALDLMIENKINKRVNTTEMVKIIKVEPGGPGGAAGYVDVQPLVRQTDAFDKTLEPTTIYKVPYFRMQCGGAAIVMDPQPGDIGMVSFTKRDSSNVKQGQSETVPPGSFRTFDQGDGILMGTILNKAPETYVEMSPDEKRVTTRAPEKADTETKVSEVNASESATTNTKDFAANASQTANITGGTSVGISAPQVGISGNLSVSGEGGGSGESEFKGNMRIIGNLRVEGNITVTGGITAGADIVAGGISLINHIHSGVVNGPNNTGRPVN